MNLRRFSQALFFLVFVCCALQAQNYRAKIAGLITDPTGAVVPNATVTLTNVNTGVRVVRTTSDSGLYLFDLVDPGSYSVSVEATGFSRFLQENVTVQTRDDITVN